MYKYRLMNLAPEIPEGHEFSSKIPDLEKHPELWAAESPYTISHKAINHVKVIPEPEKAKNEL